MAARKPKSYKIVGALAIIRKGKSERYLYRDAVFPADQIDDENAKHLLRCKLIAPVGVAAAAEEPPTEETEETEGAGEQPAS